MDQRDIDFDNWLHDYDRDSESVRLAYERDDTQQVLLTGAGLRTMLEDAYKAGYRAGRTEGTLDQWN